MTNKEILHTISHRPWKLPAEKWKFYQEWNDVIFLHWIVDEDLLRKFVPNELEIDLIDGDPWISIVAFSMEKVSPRYLPAFPPVSDFLEVNIRTYVKYNDKSGVYFLSIEGGKRLSCLLARKLTGLPYRYSAINRSSERYSSENKLFKDQLTLQYSVGQALETKSEIDKWLTERYALFDKSKTSINEFEIHHVEWPIFSLEINEILMDYPRFQELIKKPEKLHYSPGVQVLAWDKRKEK